MHRNRRRFVPFRRGIVKFALLFLDVSYYLINRIFSFVQYKLIVHVYINKV